MPRLVLTVIGDDRAGLVSALSAVVTDHGGNWEQSQLAELAGKFAGIVVVSVAADATTDLTTALHSLDGLLEVTPHPGAETATKASSGASGSGSTDHHRLTIDLVGTDRPGIVHEVTSVLSQHDLLIETMITGTRDAPMAGGVLFEAHVVVQVPTGADSAPLRAELEKVAGELFVDIAVA